MRVPFLLLLDYRHALTRMYLRTYVRSFVGILCQSAGSLIGLGGSCFVWLCVCFEACQNRSVVKGNENDSADVSTKKYLLTANAHNIYVYMYMIAV